MAKKPASVLRRSAAEIKHYKNMKKIASAVVGLLIILAMLLYIVALLYSRFGSFSVSVPNYINSNKYALSLYFTPGDPPTSRLNAKVSTDITNIDGETLPLDLDDYDGVHSGNNYAAYTFYCENAGSETVTYKYSLFIAHRTNEIDKAVRVRLYIDGQDTTYARVSSDGTGPEPGTEKFKTETIITEGDITNFEPHQTTRFTVVIWLEGNDPDCLDKIIGGQFKVDMSMQILGIEA